MLKLAGARIHKLLRHKILDCLLSYLEMSMATNFEQIRVSQVILKYCGLNKWLMHQLKQWYVR